MSGSHAIPEQGRAGDYDAGERAEELEALDDFRETLAQVRAAILRGGDGTGALIRATWRMGPAGEAIEALARRQVMVEAIAGQAVADYKASLDAGPGNGEPEPRLSVVR